jgi:formate hydrogenlyase transcriptional activator
VASTDSVVLIQGETGTGKELIAKAIHNQSSRREAPFLKMNCAAIPADLLENELFGHEKGAFTGAVAQTMGRFQLAHRGTLFLDEIGDLPVQLQPKLLRVLQEQEFERLGSGRPIKVDVRVVTATNQELLKLVQGGQFRADLYYRLNVFPICLPPLRDRSGDIPSLVRHFVRKYSQRLQRNIEYIPDGVMDALKRYDWPGNIRELQNIVERAVILSETDTFFVDESCLKRESAESRQPREKLSTLADREVEMIEAALADCHGRISGPSGAAAKLGIPRQTLRRRRVESVGDLVPSENAATCFSSLCLLRPTLEGSWPVYSATISSFSCQNKIRHMLHCLKQWRTRTMNTLSDFE